MKKVVIDIGHGGKDYGATANKLIEKELNLVVGLEIKRILDNYDVIAELTRTSDTDLTPDERVRLVNTFNPDLCVSIHHNAAGSSSARGAEVIHAHYDEYDDKLALDILDRLAGIGMPSRRSFTKLNDRKEDWYYMIRRIWNNDTDAIIVEGGFLTNYEDAKLLKSQDYLHKEAKAIADAIISYLNLQPINIIPAWQVEAFKKLCNKGIINTPEYWENRLADKISIGEMFGVLAKMI